MKKLLSLALICAMIIGLLPSVIAAADVRTENEWVFTTPSHGKSGILSPVTGNNSDFTLSGTDTSRSDKWGFVNLTGAHGCQVRDYFYYYYKNANPAVYYGTPRAFVLEIETDLSGKVSPSLTISKNTYSSCWEVFLVEKPSNAADWQCDTAGYGAAGVETLIKNTDTAYRLGVVDAYAKQDNMIDTVVLPEVTVKPGNYYLVFMANGANPAWATTAEGIQAICLVSFKLKDRSVPETARYTYNITSDAVKTEADAYLNADVLKANWENNALYTNLTDGYKLYGAQCYGSYNKICTSLELKQQGLYQQITIAQKTNTESPEYFYNNTDLFARNHYMVKINVPTGGKYSVSILNRFTSSDVSIAGAATGVYIVDASKIGEITHNLQSYLFNYGVTTEENSTTHAFSAYLTDANRLGVYNSNVFATDSNTPAVTKFDKTVDLAAGQYYLLFDLDSESYQQSQNYWDRNGYYQQCFTLSGIQLTPVDTNDYEGVQSAYDAIVKVDPENAEEVALASTTSNVKVLCGADGSVLYTGDVNAGEEITHTAPKKDGATFLYWAQGLGEYKKIVSYNETLSVKAEKGPMWLTAVYADNAATQTEVVFYDANGDEISRSRYDEGVAITLAELPSMAGFETAYGWTLDTDGTTYALTDEVKASGKLMRFVAAYPEGASESFDITVVGGSADKATAIYGETVTVSATAREGLASGGFGAKLFNYWMKDGEIVSFDLYYSFKVWKDTTVTAVYNNYTPLADAVRKIILGTRAVGDETAVVAEFIGITDAVEKGILFGTNIDNATHKVSMKTDGDTFSVIDNVTGDAVGYAILQNGSVIYSK